MPIERAPIRKNRQHGGLYEYILQDGTSHIGLWVGNRWNCCHFKERCYCIKCNGSSLCEHNKKKTKCNKCKNLVLLAKICDQYKHSI